MTADPRRRKWRRRCVALVLALGAGFAAGEILVRVLIGSPLPERLPILEIQANPRRGWEMVPGEHYTYQHPVHVNRMGLRGPEIEEKRAGEFRILALGDSLVYGQGVGDDDTLPAQLERVLAERDPEHRWTVVNAGHRAYDTRQELALLEELGERIDPDLVILFWYRNDLFGREIQGTFERLEARGRVAFDTGTRVEGWQRAKWYAREALRRSALVMFLHDFAKRIRSEPPSADVVALGLVELGKRLEHFRTLAEQRGARALFAVIADRQALVDEGARSVEERAFEQARERGITCLDLFPALREHVEQSGRLPVLPFDGHYTAEGNRAMAEAAADAVLALLGDGEPAR